jgi:hypothetical protein
MKDRRLMWTVIAGFAMLALVLGANGVGIAPAVAASPVDGVLLQATPQPTEEPADETGLTNLDSYRSTMHIEWTGTRSGEPVEGFVNVEMAYVREPRASAVTMEASGLGDVSEDGSMTMRYVRVGNQVWYYDGTSDSWSQMTAGDDDESFGVFSPSEMLPNIDLDSVRSASKIETVNDIECHRYEFTEKAIKEEKDFGDITKAKGTIWEAVDGGFLVKVVMDADVASMEDNELFDKGSLSLAYDVYDVNVPFVIEPPTEAEGNTGQRDDIPMLPDAQIEFSMMGMVSYTTASSLKEATDFYKKEMPANGWKAQKDGETVLEDFVLLNYSKDADKANIMISRDNDKKVTSVMISVQSESETLGKDAEMGGTEEGDDSDATQGKTAFQPPKDVPLMPDADVDPMSDETYIVYTTSASLKEIQAFYQKEMPANGWEPEKGNDLVGNGYLDYSKDGGKRVANIYASEEDGHVTVDIFLTTLD